MAKNSFLHPLNEVHLDKYKPQDVKEALADGIKHAKAVEKQVLSIPDTERTYQNTIQALNDSTEKLGLVGAVVSQLSSIIDEKWDKADQIVSERLAAFSSKRALNKKIYLAIKSVWDRRADLGLTAAQQKLIEDELKEFERNGINLPKDKQTRLRQIRARLAKLGSQFERNTVKATKKAHLVIKTKDKLKGISQDLINKWHEEAKEKNIQGYYIQVSEPNSDAVLSSCDVSETRLAYHKASASRAPSNKKIIVEMLNLRKELAKLLGYKNIVDYVTERRMAKSAQNVANFNEDLYKTFKPLAMRDAKELQDYIRKREGNPHYKLHITDIASNTPLYYGQKMAAERLKVNYEALREYLPLNQVLGTMFGTLKTLYGVTVKKSNDPVPHKDIETYRLYDEQGRHLSTVWCDWFARKGKRGGAWCLAFYDAPRNGEVTEPTLGSVSANLPPPNRTKPSLLSIRDVETVWHEFGHFMHHTCSNTELREHSGTNVKWDFVEAPSQIMENWVWQPEILGKMAKHYKTGKPLAKNTIQNLIKARSYWYPEFVMQQLGWNLADQALHTRYDPARHGDVVRFYQKTIQKLFPAPVPIYSMGICNFGHIFGGGYFGAYYSYRWAEVIEADLFSRFEKEGVLNPKTGREYRDRILARGGEVDPDQLVRDFLGRDFTPKALLRRSGAKTA